MVRAVGKPSFQRGSQASARRAGSCVSLVFLGFALILAPAGGPAFGEALSGGGALPLPEGAGDARGALSPGPGAENSPQSGQPALSGEESLRISSLIRALGTEDLVPILAAEGQQASESSVSGDLTGQAGESWRRAVGQIYDPGALTAALTAALAEGFAGQAGTVTAGLAFYQSPLGQRVVAAEVAARRLLSDPAEMEAAEVALDRLGEERDPRLKLYRDLIAAADHIESNVAIGLSSALAYERGLVEGEPEALRPDEAHLAAQIWAQEGEYRASSAAWALVFANAAYGSLGEEDLRAFAGFAASEEGRRLNRLIFAAYGVVLERISYRLGVEAGLMRRGLRI